MTDEKKQVQSLAASATLFFGIATQPQADAIAFTLENEFLKNGGLVTTLHNTGQQWDAPNGWAPLQWMSIIGLEKYNYTELASTIASRWIQLNKDVFTRTGKLMEKYNVVDTHLEAGGGEYEGQDGFGWTNGVLLALMKKFK
jgi:alpha,alpha-trehalase